MIYAKQKTISFTTDNQPIYVTATISVLLLCAYILQHLAWPFLAALQQGKDNNNQKFTINVICPTILSVASKSSCFF